MICPKCSTQNDDEYIFCVNCGASIPGVAAAKTEEYPSVATLMGKPAPTVASIPDTLEVRDTASQPTPFYEDAIPAKKTSSKWPIVAIAVLFLIVAGGAAIYFATRPGTRVEALPDHLGLFSFDQQKNLLNEVKKQEFVNVRDGRDALIKETSAPIVNDKPEFVLYADAAEIPVNDLKFVRLDSITDQGTMKHIEFQAAFVDDKPAMKRLRFQNALPNGRYAFALFDGYFEEGKHKLWAFEVTGSTAGNVFSAASDISIALKPKEQMSPDSNKDVANTAVNTKPPEEIPAGSRVAYCNATDVIVRNSPSLKARKISELRRGQTVYVIRYSENYDNWNGIQSNWAYIQTESGKRGWVFTPFIAY